MSHRLLWPLVLLFTFSGCAASNDDDDDRVQPPDDDDDGLTRYEGTVTDWITGAPIAGVPVGVGDSLDETDSSGEYSIASPLIGPQQVDFYESDGVTTYADCETTHAHQIYSPQARDEARDGSVEVTVRITGFTDTGSLSGSWYRLLEDGSYWFEEFRGRGPSDNGDGAWLLSLETDPASQWWLTVAELDRGLVTWGMASGGPITGAEDEVILDLELSDAGLVTSSWDGATDPRVTSVRVTQDVMAVDDYNQVPLPILESVPTGGVEELVMVAVGGDGVQVQIQRNDLELCDSHSQRWEFEHEVARTLEVPQLYDVYTLSNGSGEGDWRFRPEVRWDNVPDDPSGFAYAYFYTFGVDAWTSWSIQTSAECALETASWPAQWPDVPAESYGWISAYYYGPDTSTYCSSSIEFPSL